MHSVSIKLIQRIREEFEEAPWLRFTVGEAAQFWGLDVEQCDAVIRSLVAQGLLAAGVDGRFATQFSHAVDFGTTATPARRAITERTAPSGPRIPWFGRGAADRGVRFHRSPNLTSALCCAR